jgi:hypothetical protein
LLALNYVRLWRASHTMAMVNDTFWVLGSHPRSTVTGGHLELPYVGAATNWWDRYSPGPSGYDEKYKHAYVDGGLLVQFSPAARAVATTGRFQ